MISFRDYYLAEEEMNYHVGSSRIFVNQNLSTAKDLLRKNKEFVEQLSADQNISQYDTEEQRDLVTAAYTLLKKDKEAAKKLGLVIHNEETFMENTKKKIIDPVRRTSIELGIENPTMKQVKDYIEGSDKKEEEEPKEKETPKKEETPETEEAPEKAETSTDDEEDEDDDDEEEAKSLVDDDKFPNPKKYARQIRELKDSKVEELNGLRKSEGATKEHAASIDRAIKNIETELTKLEREASGQIKGYEVYPTRSSMIKASTKGAIAFQKARTAVDTEINKAKRRELPSEVMIGLKRAQETGKKILDAGRKGLDAPGVKKARDAVGRAAKVGGDKARAVYDRFRERSTVDALTKSYGADAAKKYVDLLRQGKGEEAKKYADELIKKHRSDRNIQNLDSRIQDQNQAMKRD